jgi:hypothetical protein
LSGCTERCTSASEGSLPAGCVVVEPHLHTHVVVANIVRSPADEVLVADDPPELGFGEEHPGGGPAAEHVAVLPMLHVALSAAGLDHPLPSGI